MRPVLVRVPPHVGSSAKFGPSSANYGLEWRNIWRFRPLMLRYRSTSGDFWRMPWRKHICPRTGIDKLLACDWGGVRGPLRLGSGHRAGNVTSQSKMFVVPLRTCASGHRAEMACSGRFSQRRSMVSLARMTHLVLRSPSRARPQQPLVAGWPYAERGNSMLSGRMGTRLPRFGRFHMRWMARCGQS